MLKLSHLQFWLVTCVIYVDMEMFYVAQGKKGTFYWVDKRTVPAHLCLRLSWLTFINKTSLIGSFGGRSIFLVIIVSKHEEQSKRGGLKIDICAIFRFVWTDGLVPGGCATLRCRSAVSPLETVWRRRRSAMSICGQSTLRLVGGGFGHFVVQTKTGCPGPQRGWSPPTLFRDGSKGPPWMALGGLGFHFQLLSLFFCAQERETPNARHWNGRTSHCF